MFEELRKRYQTRSIEVPSYEDTVLSLQLSDTLDLETSWKSVPKERFRNLVKDSPEPWDAVREDPFRFYDFRNRGYLQFNRGFLAFDVLKAIIEDAQRNDMTWGTLRLSWQGEPLLHPQMEEILQWLAEAWQSKPFAARIEIPTNATLLNHNYCRITADHGAVPFVWVFEVDAWDADSYLLHHGEGLWNRVLDNINFLLQEVRDKQPRQMGIVLQCTLTEATAEGAEKFRDFWTEHLATYELEARVSGQAVPGTSGIHIHFRRPDPPDLEGIRAARALYSEALERLGLQSDQSGPDESKRRVCAAYWKTPTISWDGKVMLCTADVQQTMKVGEATLDSLCDSWWRGPRLHQIRKQAVREDFSGLNLCRGCNQPYSPNSVTIDSDEIDRYMASAE